jgi:hypothetical protein
MAFKLKIAICGGQTGVDQIMLNAARECGIITGGTAAKGWMTETGSAGWLADYGLVECDRPGYPARTIKNVMDSNGTALFGDPKSRGSQLAIETCKDRRPIIINPGVVDFLAFLVEYNIEILNVGGNRGSKLTPREGYQYFKILMDVFQIIKLQQHG